MTRQEIARLESRVFAICGALDYDLLDEAERDRLEREMEEIFQILDGLPPISDPAPALA